MKRATPRTSIGSNDKHLKPFKKLKDGITSDDPSLSNVGQSGHIEEAITVDPTKNKSKNLFRDKKTPGKQEKDVELNRPMITSARKKGRLSAYISLKGATGDSSKTTIPGIAEEEQCVNKTFSTPIVLGLQCNAMTILKSKNPCESSSINGVSLTLTPNTTCNLDKEADVDSVPSKKRGRPLKRQAKRSKNSLALNGEATKQKKTSSSAVANVEKVSNGIALSLQQDKYDKPVKGKRGKRRTISSINIHSSSPQGGQDSWSHKANGSSEICVDTMPDDQPLSRWFRGIRHHSATVNDTDKKQLKNGGVDVEKLCFEKRSSLWETMESMEAFRTIAQKPHFRPLEGLKESARERQAISLMVNFSGVFEDTCRLRFENPTSEIEDQLETVSELESHGFDVSVIRKRLLGLVEIKEEQEKLEKKSKEVKDKIQEESVEGKEIEKGIEMIDKQVNGLVKKRSKLLSKKVKKDTDMAALEQELDGIKQGMNESRCKFHELAAASLSL